MRFALFANGYRDLGCHLLIYPSLCDVETGRSQWQLLARARALDNQLFVAFCAPARDLKARLVSYGHSTIADPNGCIMGELDEQEGILVRDLDVAQLHLARKSTPIYNQRRNNLYRLTLPNSNF
ncbi:uncharacterized protein LOC129738280 [Uranotaenia lowii]|uniref:uncharacterized protein LOC129738280 n=1 Tax=Uranotaenia lowii TaxID=190385 RepID=UPI002479C09A|nr:uncharacterized protein LOC129738280 [Uranotaenia lowii]